MVRAKFKVVKIELTEGSKPVFDENGKQTWEKATMYSIHASPVYGNGDPNHENTKFWQASPNGSLMIGCVNADAVKMFELGMEFYLDMSPA